MLSKYLSAFYSGVPFPGEIVKNNFLKSGLETSFSRSLTFLKQNGNPTTLSIVRDFALFPGVLINIYTGQQINPKYSYDVYAFVGTGYRSACKMLILSNSEAVGSYSSEALDLINYGNSFSPTIEYIDKDHYAFSARLSNLVCEPASVLINRIIPEQKQMEADPALLNAYWYTYVFKADKSQWLAKVGIASVVRPLVSDYVGEAWKTVKNIRTIELISHTPFEIKTQLLNQNFPELNFDSSEPAWDQVETILSSNHDPKTKMTAAMAILTTEYSCSLVLEVAQGYYFMIPTRGINMMFEDFYKSNGIYLTASTLVSLVAVNQGIKYYNIPSKSYDFISQNLPIDYSSTLFSSHYNHFNNHLEQAIVAFNKHSSTTINKVFIGLSNAAPESQFIATYYLLNIQSNTLSNSLSLISNPGKGLSNFLSSSYNIFFKYGTPKELAIKTAETVTSSAVTESSVKGTIGLKAASFAYLGNIALNLFELAKAAPFSMVYSKSYDHYVAKLGHTSYGSTLISYENDLVKNKFMNYLFNKSLFNCTQNTWDQVEVVLDTAQSAESKVGSSLVILSHDYLLPGLIKFMFVGYLVKKTVDSFYSPIVDNKDIYFKSGHVVASSLLIYYAREFGNFVETTLDAVDGTAELANEYLITPGYCTVFSCENELEVSGKDSGEL